MATVAEMQSFIDQDRKNDLRAEEMFDPWWEYGKKFHEKDGRTHRWKGYEFMQRFEKWMKKYPEIRQCTVDDDFAAGSRLYFVPHRSTTDPFWHGVSVIFAPQCTGEPPTVMSLYPHHMEDLQKVLAALTADMKKCKTYR